MFPLLNIECCENRFTMTSTTHLSPLLHVPTKRTDEVDFAPSFRAYIQSTYQDDPDKYANEIATLNRLRQDTRGAGKDVTGRDILYRYYGQLELLDLRFPVEEKAVKVLFTWYGLGNHPEFTL